MDEAHVQHSVGLIEDEELDIIEVDVALPVEVEQSAGCGNQYIDTTTKVVDLWPLVYTAKNHSVTHGKVPTVGLKIITNLRSELSCRCEDECADDGLALAGLTRELLEGGEQERCGLARTCLGATENISALKQGRNRRGLNRCGGHVVLLGERTLNGLDEVERVEGRHGGPG